MSFILTLTQSPAKGLRKPWVNLLSKITSFEHLIFELIDNWTIFGDEPFSEVTESKCTLVQKSYCYTPASASASACKMLGQNWNVKVMKFQSLCIFSCILILLIILVKPQQKLTTGAHPVTVAPLVFKELNRQPTKFFSYDIRHSKLNTLKIIKSNDPTTRKGRIKFCI